MGVRKVIVSRNHDVGVLLGKTIISINGGKDSNYLSFRTTDGDSYLMHHEPECCESVTLEDVFGDLEDLIGSEILLAEKVTNVTQPEDYDHVEHGTSCDDEELWTFYKFATLKGYVDLRWYGTSNGYYSVSVQLDKWETTKGKVQ